MTKVIALGRYSNGSLIPIAVDNVGKIILSDCGPQEFQSLIVGDFENGNYFEVESDGTWVSNGDAATWDDLNQSATLALQGQTSKPNYDFTELGLLFPQNDATEIARIIKQMHHKKKMDTKIYYHVHYIQDEEELPVFKIDYRFYKNGEEVPAWKTISTAEGDGLIFDYTAGTSIMQILPFPAIDAPANETVSANIDVKFYRDDNVVTGDVLVKYIDLHYQIDTSGSRDQYLK